MSTRIATIPNSGRKKTKLDIDQFRGEGGPMLQLTQGFASLLTSPTCDEPGFIQLTLDDVTKLIEILTKWKEENDTGRQSIKSFNQAAASQSVLCDPAT